jgi:hypothetical protein
VLTDYRARLALPAAQAPALGAPRTAARSGRSLLSGLATSEGEAQP